MAPKPVEIEIPHLALNHCSVEEHCLALRNIKKLPFWWYQGTSKLFGNFSLPLKDRNGNWWYQVKPGLCWPVDFFKPIGLNRACPSFNKTYFGYQHLVDDDSQANSHLVINTIFDLKDYGIASVSSKRRNKIRQGLKYCRLEAPSRIDKKTLDVCRANWDDLSERTGWKHAAREGVFDDTWRMVLDCPGSSIILAREKASGEVVGFLIVKIIGDTAYNDTIAVGTNNLRTRANDALRYAFLANATKIPGVTKAYSAPTSFMGGLEEFKKALGYVPHPFPTNLRLRPGTGFVLRLLFPSKYRRLTGQLNVSSQESSAT